jgi:hypothetical protein
MEFGCGSWLLVLLLLRCDVRCWIIFDAFSPFSPVIGFDASVGVTSGAAYCGLVGSSTRHEYAVMGPSTNLSARLMGRAAAGEILCDSAIRQRDRTHTFLSLGAVKAKGYANPVPIFRPRFGFNSGAPAEEGSTVVVRPALSISLPEEATNASPDLAAVFGRKNESLEVFRFLFASAVQGSLETLQDTFWIPAVQESEDVKHAHAVELPSYEFAVKSLNSSKKRQPRVQFATKTGRFNINQPTKKVVIISPNGMGKTAFLNLFQFKLDELVRKDSDYYNIAVFRHQTGFINSATVFSAWFCIVRQTLHSIATALAQETTDATAAKRLEALQQDNFLPIVEFLTQYLPLELQPFVSVLKMVGLRFVPEQQPTTAPEDATAPAAAADEKDSGVDTAADTDAAAAEQEEPSPESGKTDPVSALDASDQLQKCAEVVVAIVQLHVQITRRLTVYIM